MKYQLKKNLKKAFSYRISIKDFILTFWKTILIWIFIVIFILIALHFKVDKLVIGGIVVIFGLVTEAFIGILGIICLVPILGPIIAKILALPLFWIINSLGYFLSIIAIKKGYSREVISYRILTIVFLVGIVVGFIIGRVI
jgi:hypothetical protein